jgi:hypothetical protein
MLQPTNKTCFSQPEPEALKPETWMDEITELERFFETATIPAVPVKLNEFTTITNCSLFIRNHLATVKANNGNKTFLPYLHRLRQLKQKLTSHEDK